MHASPRHSWPACSRQQSRTPAAKCDSVVTVYTARQETLAMFAAAGVSTSGAAAAAGVYKRRCEQQGHGLRPTAASLGGGEGTPRSTGPREPTYGRERVNAGHNPERKRERGGGPKRERLERSTLKSRISDLISEDGPHVGDGGGLGVSDGRGDGRGDGGVGGAAHGVRAEPGGGRGGGGRDSGARVGRGLVDLDKLRLEARCASVSQPQGRGGRRCIAPTTERRRYACNNK